jgi:hypothetical protein
VGIFDGTAPSPTLRKASNVNDDTVLASSPTHAHTVGTARAMSGRVVTDTCPEESPPKIGGTTGSGKKCPAARFSRPRKMPT